METMTTTTEKSSDPEPEIPTRIQQQQQQPLTTAVTIKPLSFSNGVLKRNHQQIGSTTTTTAAAASSTAVIYKECLKNHAASLGGHAVDGCGEFMPSPTVTAGDPSSIKCAACGCHRNFHRREPDEPPISTTTHVIEYQPHHRHLPPPPPPPSFQPPPSRSPNSSSPPPISSSYYPSAPHMLLALSVPPESTAAPANTAAMGGCSVPSPRKRFRTKFSQEQKEKMHEFAERVGWKMQKRDEDLVMEFCNEVGVDRSVLKVWMHNNKNTFGKKDVLSIVTNNNNNASNGVVLGTENVLQQPHNNNNNNNNDDSAGSADANVGSAATNGSSSS